MELVLPFNQTKAFTYEDIHATMKLIRENNTVANQIKGFILKVIGVQNFNLLGILEVVNSKSYILKLLSNVFFSKMGKIEKINLFIIN